VIVAAAAAAASVSTSWLWPSLHPAVIRTAISKSRPRRWLPGLSKEVAQRLKAVCPAVPVQIESRLGCKLTLRQSHFGRFARGGE
jgi:hypothetical protein